MEYVKNIIRKLGSQPFGRICLAVMVEFPHKCEICKRAILSDPGRWCWNRLAGRGWGGVGRGEGEARARRVSITFPFPLSLCFSTSLLMTRNIAKEKKKKRELKGERLFLSPTASLKGIC